MDIESDMWPTTGGKPERHWLSYSLAEKSLPKHFMPRIKAARMHDEKNLLHTPQITHRVQRRHTHISHHAVKWDQNAQRNTVTVQGWCLPEEALAALAGHGIEMEAGGLVPAHATDPRGVAVKLIRSDHRRRHRHGLHHWSWKESRHESLCDWRPVLCFQENTHKKIKNKKTKMRNMCDSMILNKVKLICWSSLLLRCEGLWECAWRGGVCVCFPLLI